MVTKRDEYIRRFHECRALADGAATPEITALWDTIARSYRLLVERQDRLAGESKENGIGFYQLF